MGLNQDKLAGELESPSLSSLFPRPFSKRISKDNSLFPYETFQLLKIKPLPCKQCKDIYPRSMQTSVMLAKTVNKIKVGWLFLIQDSKLDP